MGVTVLSGASSVLALSSAVVVALSKVMDEIDLIGSVILPGNRTPRGISVVHAILAQVGWVLGAGFVTVRGASGFYVGPGSGQQ